jgi:hypothetical protein
MQSQLFERRDKTFLDINFSLFLNFVFIYHRRERTVNFASISYNFLEEGVIEVVKMNLKVSVALAIQFSLYFILLGLPNSIMDVFAFENIVVIFVELEKDCLLDVRDFEDIFLENSLSERIR